MTITIEDSQLQEQAINPEYVKQQIALLLYEKQILTLFQAANMVGMDIATFKELMKNQQVPISYNEADLSHDLAMLPHIFPIPKI
jgi:predicted HTH domain antitoxin